MAISVHLTFLSCVKIWQRYYIFITILSLCKFECIKITDDVIDAGVVSNVPELSSIASWSTEVAMVSIVTSILFPWSVLTLTLEVAECCEVWIGEEGGGEDEEELVEGVRTVVPLAGITRRERRGGGERGRRGEKEGGGERVGGERGSVMQIGTQIMKITSTPFTAIPKI